MMGGHEWGTPAGRSTLREVRLNRGGYDSYGSYWGGGQRLYQIDAEESAEAGGYGRVNTEARRYFRAAGRADAIAHVKATWPRVTLARGF